MSPAPIEVMATVLFTLAVIHTFLVKKFQHMAHKYPQGSIGENFFHFMGEVEAVFGMWAAIFVGFMMILESRKYALEYLQNTNFTEPAFVFVIMAMAATRPVIKLAEAVIVGLSRLIPLPQKFAFYVSVLIFGPVLGSFITEPAAMTVTALILQKNFFSQQMSDRFKYATIGLLFVNVSIGGTLTHFAAPPVLMVAGTWGWTMRFMMGSFGYKALVAIAISTFAIAALYRKELLGDFELRKEREDKMHPAWWITLVHCLFLAAVVRNSHYMVIFFGLFLFFLGFVKVTEEYQDELKLKDALMVGFFLGGLVVLGSLQKWWLQPLLASLETFPLYLGSTILTAVTDNAALTYLGSLVELTDEKKYYLVAGAVTGGGLTVIANAPNPAGYGILKENFGEDGVDPLKLFLAALFPTFMAFLAFKFLASI